ncbi:MAG: SNF2-related protein [Lutibacter sp.]|jgi:hypothetical protein
MEKFKAILSGSIAGTQVNSFPLVDGDKIVCGTSSSFNMIKTDYLHFLESKKHSISNYGIEPTFIPDAMFDFQKYVTEYLIRKGRAACFLDTGLGKTIIELTVAKNYIQHTNKPVLIICPLAVAFQFIKEAEKFSIDDISYSKDGKYKTKIVICNYERLGYFESTDFDCVMLDESSILKNFEGETKLHVTNFMRKVKYRYLFTATPSPNDYIELGTSSEALGYMGYTDILTRFFKNNNNTIKSSGLHRAGEEWYLKPHAEKDFWKWIASWSISMRKPSDIGFDDSLYILPRLNEIETIVANSNPLAINGQTQMFNMPAVNFFEIKAEVRATIKQRCEMAVKKCLEHDISFCWVNLNEEGKMIEKMLPNSIDICGGDDVEKKEEAIEWFIGDKCICNSKYFHKLVLNWQNKGSCGNLNTQNEGEKNIAPINQKGIYENRNPEILMKIKNTWQNIISKTKTNTGSKMLMNEIENEENIIQIIQNIEKNVNDFQLTMLKQIHINELNELLGYMDLLLMNIIQFLTSNKIDVQFAKKNLIEVEKNLWLLTIVTKPEKLEEFSAYHVISDLDISKTTLLHSNLQSCICGHKSGVRRIISKTKIFGFGLNLQHCNHTTYFPTYSYEQYYQAIRRFWRFGQKREVFVDLILSDGQTRIMQSLKVKKNKAISMFENLTANTNSDFTIKTKEFDKKIITPTFIK